MQLKKYQVETLKKLGQYCDLVRSKVVAGDSLAASHAYQEICGEPYNSTPQLPDTPYICLRVPTGGGKTLIAAHAVGTIAKHLGHQDRPLCLWVTPSTPICCQTLQGLKDRDHPYHEALRRSLGNEAIEVISIEDARSMNRSMLTSTAVVVVTTIQSYRIDDTDGRKIYEDNGYLMDHFSGMPPWLREQLAEPDDGMVRLSLANVMKMRGPIVIMDESHNARTRISFESLARFSPLAVLELTATPLKVHDEANEKYASNVLHHVPALQLKKEGMIKLPVEMESRGDWLEVLARAVELRDDLERQAVEFRKKSGRYIRPIALIQAQPRNQNRETHTIEAVMAAMVGQLKVPKEYVRTHDEIDGEDFRSEKCDVRYIVTVEKLREGWDCPFAYVLGSIGNVATETAVEQLLGRVMRMPHAIPTGISELDRAYAVVQSTNVVETAKNLCDSLVKYCGFDLRAAQEAVQAHRQGDSHGRLPLFWIEVTTPITKRSIPVEIREKVEYDPDMGAIWLRTPLTPQETSLLRNALPEADHPAVDEYLHNQYPDASVKPKKEARPFHIPRLVVREGNSCILFEPAELKEFDWNLDACNTTVSENDFSTELNLGNRLELGLNDAGVVSISPLERVLVRQLTFWSEEELWDKGRLVAWLDQDIHRGGSLAGLPKSKSGPWLLRLVDSLMSQRKCGLGILVRKRWSLAAVARTMITDHGREQVRLAAKSLIDMRNPNRRLETSMAAAAVLDSQLYDPPQKYTGNLTFKHDAFDVIGAMNDEELLCASQIDSHPNIKRWVRNLEDEGRGGFFLPLSPRKFFPDFIAELKDGRIAIIEYKNPILDKVEQHKKSVGELWASRSDGQCVFAWIVDKDWATLEKTLIVKS